MYNKKKLLDKRASSNILTEMPNIIVYNEIIEGSVF